MTLGLPEAALIVGALLGVTAALSGWMRGTVLSISVLSMAAGIALGVAGVLDVDADEAWLIVVVELALVVTLFADGLIVEEELLRERWRDPVRALVAAMPITLVLIAVAGLVLFPELSWQEALLLAAVLAPTDPVVTSSVVSSIGVPARVRHALNLESGLNDGLALPFVLVFLALSSGGDAGHEALVVGLESGLGAVIGAAVGAGSGRLSERLPGGDMRPRYEGVYALGMALLAFGLAESTIGNGLVATFVAAIMLAVSRPDVPEAFAEFNESVSAVLQVVTFVLFGALIVGTGFAVSAPALAAFVVLVLFVARPAAIAIAFVRSRLSRPETAFVAWFGPKGVASMLFALLVAESQAPDRTLVFDIASLVVLASIVAHGLTDTLGARWIERRLGGRG
jgi:NhaP-type Na+/H+ or K+/H+ antiporter